MRAVPSLDAVAMREPSGENATPRTQSPCPLNVVRWVPAAVSQVRAVRSSEAVSDKGAVR